LVYLLSTASQAQEAPPLDAAHSTRSVLWAQYGGLYRIYEPQLLNRFRALDLPGDADQDGDIDLSDCFFAADLLDSEDAHFDFNANGAVDMLDLLEIQEHFGQTRQGPFLVLNPQGPPLADLHIAHGKTPGAIRLYFTAPGPLDPFAFVLPQRPANLADLDRQYRAAAIDHQTQGEFHTLDIAAPTTEGMRYVAFGYQVGAATSRVLVFAWHFGTQYRALADLKRFQLHPAIDVGYRAPDAPAITDFAVATTADGRAEVRLRANRFRFDVRFWTAADVETAATLERAGRPVEILTSEGLSFERRYLLALPPGDWTLHGALLTRGAAIDAIATAPLRMRNAARTARTASFSFVDPGLEAAVRDAIARPYGALHRADIADLTRLDASGRA
ncbi:MAG: hypothetical protein QGH25_23010, partial [Candidatus Latescibacteria bacterium]|nr:hypothetical protein [Candidatus Latescibacterota bacterium]